MDNDKTRDVPLLSNDIWEHAYYLKFQNKRADYLKIFWKVVNWKQFEQYRVESLKLAKASAKGPGGEGARFPLDSIRELLSKSI